MNKIAPFIFGSFLLLLQAGAHGGSISFDPDGPGPKPPFQVTTFDWAPDNALAQKATPISFGVPRSFTLYAQGRLSNFEDASSNIITGTGLNTDYEITFQAGFGETALAIYSSSSDQVITFFSLDTASPVNFFRIYLDPAKDADKQTGDGYGNGILIMKGYATSNTTNFLLDLNPGTMDPKTEDLDQSPNGNDQPGYGAVSGSGAGTLRGVITWVNTDYVKVDLSTTILTMSFSTNHISPFQTIDPTGPATATAGVVGQIPNFGGAGVDGFDWVSGLDGPCQFGGTECDVLLSADASMTFDTAPRPVRSIPTLGVTGLGLLGLLLAGAAARRRLG